MQPRRRSPRRWERAVVYGALGVATEIAFTGVRGAVTSRDWRLEGHSYLWMFPIYGSAAYLFEPLRDRLRGASIWQRAAAYSAGIMTVEYVTGMALRRTIGAVPWDYSGRGRFVLPGGATRLDYAPLWAVAGLALERVDDVVRHLSVEPV